MLGASLKVEKWLGDPGVGSKICEESKLSVCELASAIESDIARDRLEI